MVHIAAQFNAHDANASELSVSAISTPVPAARSYQRPCDKVAIMNPHSILWN